LNASRTSFRTRPSGVEQPADNITDQLGYKDVLTWNVARPHPHLLAFLTTTLPRLLPGAAVEWTANRELVTQFAADRKLGVGNLGKIERDKIYREFSQIVFPRPDPAEDEPDQYEDEFGAIDEL